MSQDESWIFYRIDTADSGCEFHGELYAGLLHAVRHLKSDERAKLIEELKSVHAEIEGTDR